MDTITVCLGSSCFSKNSAAVAEAVNGFLGERRVDGACVSGCLCVGACAKGPNVYINDRLFSGVTVDTLDAVLLRELPACKSSAS